MIALEVDDRIAAVALQDREKHVSMTEVVLDGAGAIAGYCTERHDFQELPGHPDRLFLTAKQLQAMLRGA